MRGPSFSIGDALAAPFRLLRRRPFVLLIWGALLAAVYLAAYSAFIPIFASLPLGEGQGQAALDAYVAGSQALGATLNALSLLIYVATLLVWVAAARASLNPGRSDIFAFLRVGMDEVRVVVVYVAWFLGWYIALVLLLGIGAAIAFAVWSASREGALITAGVYGLVVLIGAVWLWIRLSLIAPASLILKDFAFAQGWAITRGQVLKLLGLYVLRWLVSILSAIVIYGIVGIVLAVGFFAQGLTWPDRIDTLADFESLVRPMLVPAAVALLPAALGWGFAFALSAGPLVVAARQLLDGSPVGADADTANP